MRHVHAHFAGLAARTAYWIERFFGIGFSFTAHANDIFAPKPFEVSLGKLIGAARAVVTVSDFGVRFLREKYPGDAAKIHRVYNGIDLARFPRAEFNGTPPAIISVGRLIEKKGFHDLIEACRVLRERGVEFRCEIIGEGPLESSLRDQITAAGLTTLVTLTGPLPQGEVIKRLARSALFVLPCVAEVGGGMDNLPTVVMEAMAAGLPVISTALGGVPEMVRDGFTGLLVPEHQPVALADALAQVLGDRRLARSLGEAGRQRAAELFAIDKSAEALRALFQQVGAFPCSWVADPGGLHPEIPRERRGSILATVAVPSCRADKESAKSSHGTAVILASDWPLRALSRIRYRLSRGAISEMDPDLQWTAWQIRHQRRCQIRCLEE